MKKELFNEIIAYMEKNILMRPFVSDIDAKVKITETEEIISCSFSVTPKGIVENFEEAKLIFKSKGYKGEEVHNLIGHRALYKSYYTVLYNKLKDKICLSTFDIGYSYAAKKGRYYPYKKKVPYLCYSNKIYQFYHKNKPRILLGTYVPSSLFSGVISDVILKIGYTCHLRIPYRYFVGTANEWEAMEKYFEQPIPKEIRTIGNSEMIFYLYKDLFGAPSSRRKSSQIELTVSNIHIGEPRTTARDGGSNDPGLFHLF